MMTKIKPIHPGQHLAEFIKEVEITEYRLSKDIGVPAPRINQIIKGRRSITADTALRLGKYFGTSPQFWANLQSNYDLDTAAQAIKLDNVLVLQERIDMSKNAER